MKNTELDKWIAENIMGWIGKNRRSNSFLAVWHPTESISDAFQVVEKMIEDDEILMCGLEYDGHRQQWRFALRKYNEIIVADFWPWADTKELAICLAAKKAIEGVG